MLRRSLNAPASRSAFKDKTARCAALLDEARWLVVVQSYGSVLNEIIDRTYDVFADIDEILITLSPLQHHDAFASVATLHRRFQEIQSLIPRTRRRR
jgi:tRNA splicing ligase